MRLAYRKPPSHLCISALTTVTIPNSSPIKKSKPVKPLSYYPCIFPPNLLTIQEVDSDEHIVLVRRSSVHFLHNMWLLTTYLRKTWLVYRFWYVADRFWFQWLQSKTWQFVCACARVIPAIRMFQTPNRVDWQLINAISSCLLQISENAQFKLEIIFTNKVSLSDGTQVIEGVVNAQRESVWMTTIMLHSSIHPTISLWLQTGYT